MYWRIFFACLVIIGGVVFIKYSGVDNAINAQNDVGKSGYYYSGETWLTTEQYNDLKESLAQRDYSIQTGSDLLILPEIQDNKLHIKYSFFSTKDYSNFGLTITEKPSWFNRGLVLANVAYIMIPIVIIIWAFRILTGGTPKKTKELTSEKTGN